MKPDFFASSNVDATTGALFQEPSSGTASRVFPRFQPGFSLAMKSAAEIDSKKPVHVGPVVDEGDVVDVEVVVVGRVFDVVVGTEVAVAGTH